MEEDGVVEEMFNIVRYRPATIPRRNYDSGNYEEYLAQFEARNLADYVATYQQSYAAMQAAKLNSANCIRGRAFGIQN